MDLKIEFVDENGIAITDPDIVEEYLNKLRESVGEVHLTEDMMPRPGHGLPQYIPGSGWLI